MAWLVPEMELRQACCAVVATTFVAGPNAVRLWQVLVLEPRARRLAPSDDGLRDPTTGASIAWRDCRDLSLGASAFELTLPSGQRISLPRCLFLDAGATARFLAARIGRGGPGPFRSTGRS